jgi:hypothetical protein
LKKVVDKNKNVLYNVYIRTEQTQNIILWRQIMTREQKYPNTDTFIYYNANPKNRLTGDCAFRAISLATGKPYNECVMEMAKLMCETGYGLTDIKGIDVYLKRLGWVKMKQPKKDDNTKYTGNEFCKIFKGTCIANIGGGHIVCIKNGKLYDTWNSTYWCIGNYWVKEV